MLRKIAAAAVTGLLASLLPLPGFATSSMTFSTTPYDGAGSGATAVAGDTSVNPIEIASGTEFKIVVGGSCSTTCTNVQYQISYSGELSFVSTNAASPSHDSVNRTLSFSGGNLANGGHTFDIVLKFPSPETADNALGRIQVFAGENGTTSSYTSSVVHYQAAADTTPSSGLSKQFPESAGIVPGNYADFVISAQAGAVANNGPLALENVQLVVDLPANSVFVPTSDAPQSGYDQANHRYTFAVGAVTQAIAASKKIRISFPISHFSIGGTVTVNGIMTGNKINQPSFSPILTSTTHTFRAPSGAPTFQKILPGSQSAINVKRGSGVSYGIKLINQSDFLLEDLVIEDSIPDGIKIDAVSGRNDALSDSAFVYIKTDFGPDGIDANSDDGDYFLLFSASPTVHKTVNLYSGIVAATQTSIPAADILEAIRYELESTELNTGPTGYNETISLTGTAMNLFRSGSVIPNLTAIPNTATFSATASAGASSQVSGSATATYTFIDPVVFLNTAGTVTPSGAVSLASPDKTFTMTAGARNNPGDADLVNPRFILLLPANVELVTWSATLPGGIPSPTTTIQADYNGTGGTKILWTWPAGTTLTMGQQWRFDADVEYQLGVYGTPAVDFLVGSNSVVSECDYGYAPYYYDRVVYNPPFSSGNSGDPYDINQDGNTAQIYGGPTFGSVTPGSTYCSRWLDVTVTPQTSAAIRSKIKGVFDSTFALGPATSFTSPGSQDTLRAELFNGGTNLIDNAVIVTRLSRAGLETTKGTSTNPASQTFPLILSSKPTTPTLSSPVTTSYTTATNPCMPEVGASPTGCSAPNWMDWSASPPAQISDVTGLKFDFGSNILSPAQTWAIEMAVTTPTSGAVETDFAIANNTGNSANDESAFMTFATQVEAAGSAVPAFESQPVTLAMPSPSGPPGYVTATNRTDSGPQNSPVVHAIPLSSGSAAYLLSGQTTVSSLVVSGEGTYTINPQSGQVVFTPISAFIGSATPISYLVQGSTGLTATASLTITITAAQTPPPAPNLPSSPQAPVPVPSQSPSVSPSTSTVSVPIQTTSSYSVQISVASASITLSVLGSTQSTITSQGYLALAPSGSAAITGSGLAPNSVVQLVSSVSGRVFVSQTASAGGTFSLVVTSTQAFQFGKTPLLLRVISDSGEQLSVPVLVYPNYKVAKLTTYFLGDSYRLTTKAKNQLAKFARTEVAGDEVLKLDLLGYVNRTRVTSYDIRLSRLRAEAVATYLRRLGVQATTTSIIPRGIAKEVGSKARRAELTAWIESKLEDITN